MNDKANLWCTHCGSRTQHDARGSARTHDKLTIGLFGCVTCARILVVSLPATEPQAYDRHVVYPTAQRPTEQLPDAVRSAFNEALGAFRAGSWNLAAVGFRTALQLACRDKGAQGKSLKAEIDDLSAKHTLPTAMSEWANQLREDGNEAAHPAERLPWGEADARDLLALAESIFEYLYVVPAAVEERRARAAAGQDP
jgi:hypothetical protein